MSQGFYEQMGVLPDAEHDRIRAAYGHAVAHLMRRREATLQQGGDTTALDLARTQLDEAWEILSDPVRRRRYDAMLAVVGDGARATGPDELWKHVAGAMIHPSVSAAARIVDAATRLGVGPLPEPPSPVASRTRGGWDEDVSVTARVQAAMEYGQRRAAPARIESYPAAAIRSSTPVVGVVETTGDDASYAGAQGRAWTEPPTIPGPSSYPGFVAQPAPRHAPSAPAVAVPVPAASSQPATTPPPAASPAPEPRASVVVPPAAKAVVQAAPPMVSKATLEITPQIPEAERLLQVYGPTGALLRAAREARKMTVQQISEATRINARLISALEDEDYATLPSTTTFVRGYVRQVAQLLELNADQVVAGYMRRFSGDA